MRRSRPRVSGFTLIELILVLLIISIVSAAIAPSFSSFTAGRRNADAATQLVSVANWARTQTISEGRPYRLNFDLQARRYWVTVQNNAVYEIPMQNDFNSAFQFPDGVQLQTDLQPQQDGMYIEFRASGRTDPASFVLTDANGRVIQVACQSATEQFQIMPDQNPVH